MWVSVSDHICDSRESLAGFDRPHTWTELILSTLNAPEFTIPRQKKKLQIYETYAHLKQWFPTFIEPRLFFFFFLFHLTAEKNLTEHKVWMLKSWSFFGISDRRHPFSRMFNGNVHPLQQPNKSQAHTAKKMVLFCFFWYANNEG